MYDLVHLLQSKMLSFSKGQKRIAAYILDNSGEAAYMTASRLGEEVGVSESTVVRFAMELGFDGYPGLHEAMQELNRNLLTSTQRMQVSNQQIADDEILEKVMQSDLDKLKRTLDSVEREQFDRAVGLLLESSSVYVMGVRSAAPLASFASFYLNLVFPNVRLVESTGSGELFERLIRLGPDSVFLAISFPRYSKRIVDMVHYAKSVGAKVISLTDNSASPIAALADAVLFARSDMASFVDSLVAPLSIINALIVACGRKRQDSVGETLGRLEQLWDEYGVYEKDTKHEK